MNKKPSRINHTNVELKLSIALRSSTSPSRINHTNVELKFVIPPILISQLVLWD